MSLAVYPGSFDPLTMGHLDIARRAAQVFDEVIVGLARNCAKDGRRRFSDEERLALARESLADIPGLRAEIIPGLLADYCREVGATALVKGLRNGSDMDTEYPMALMNVRLGAPETLFLVSDPAYAHISSSLVKEIASYGQDLSEMVPPPVARALMA